MGRRRALDSASRPKRGRVRYRSSSSRTRFLLPPSRQFHYLEQHGLAGVDQLLQRDALRSALAERLQAACEQRDVDERGKRRAVVLVRRLDRAPAQIIAEIA